MSERVKWDSRFAFLMAAIGSAVGLGNIWRFPYLFYTGGQGTFMIPYIIAILVVGFPFLLFEYSVGSNFKKSVVSFYHSVDQPIKTAAWITLGIMALYAVFYAVLISWNLDYFVLSLFNGWGTNPDFFFNNVFLQSTTSLSGVFQIVPSILIASIIVWAIIWLILSRDINKGIGQFCKIFVPLFLILCVGLVIYEVFLPGASIGYMRFFQPNWNALGDLNIWLAAFSQVVFTLSLGYTLNMSYGSHLYDDEDLPISTLSIILANCGFEIVNAIGIFSILGYMSYSSGIPFDSLITQGTGLVFVALPIIFNILGPIGRVIGPIFFFSVVLIEISTIIGVLEPLVDSVSFEFNRTRKKVITIVAIVSIIISILFASRIGNLLIVNVDFLVNNILIMCLIISQCIIFGHIYKVDKIISFINKNSALNVSWIKLFIKYIIPIFLSILVIYGIYELFTNLNSVSLLIYIGVILFVVIFTIILTYLSNKHMKSLSENKN